MDDDLEINFKRFPREKQEQIRQLVNYATLMGLDGKDLISIGSKLERIKSNATIQENRKIIAELVKAGIISRPKSMKDPHKWLYHSGGTKYLFKQTLSDIIVITNLETNRKNTFFYPFVIEDYNLGHNGFKVLDNYNIANIMLNVYHGKIPLP